MSESFISERVDRGAVPLAVGDLLVILLVIALGMVNHGSLTGPAALLATAAPFLVGWAVSSVPVGAYSAGAAESAKAAVPLAIRSWVPAAVVGIVIRGATQSAFGTGLAVFLVVMVVTGSVALAVWRWVFFAVR
ncbi:MAG: DUF3054 domain-containing protein [Halolamina sp.]